MMAQPQRISSATTGHLFRSKFLDTFARLEVWTIAMWRGLARAGVLKAKVSPAVGDRLKRIGAATSTHAALFASATQVAELLDQLKPYCGLRIRLVHSAMTMAADGGAVRFIFENPLVEKYLAFDQRSLLKEEELDRILADLDDLIGRLLAQDLV